MKDINVISTTRPHRRTYSQKEYSSIKKKCNMHIILNYVLILVVVVCVVTIGRMYLDLKDKDSTISELEYKIEEQNKINDTSNDKITNLINSIDDASNMIDSLSVDIENLNKQLEEAESYINNSIAAPTDKRYTRHSDLSITEVINADRMNRIIDYWNERAGGNSPFAGNGQAFIKASQQTGYDPIFIFAICSHESGFGTSNIAKTKGNFCGIGAYDDSPYESAITMSSNNIEEAIIKNAEWLHNNYYENNQESLDDMIYGKKCYSSSKETWIAGITSIMNRSSKIK